MTAHAVVGVPTHRLQVSPIRQRRRRASLCTSGERLGGRNRCGVRVAISRGSLNKPSMRLRELYVDILPKIVDLKTLFVIR